MKTSRAEEKYWEIEMEDMSCEVKMHQRKAEEQAREEYQQST